nr:MAG TPA: hypothetical protein [Caudoviricetes sp.]
MKKAKNKACQHGKVERSIICDFWKEKSKNDE